MFDRGLPAFRIELTNDARRSTTFAIEMSNPSLDFVHR